jgi:hypothetical protein
VGGEPDDRVWHIVSMSPLSDPEDGFCTGVSEAAGDERT